MQEAGTQTEFSNLSELKRKRSKFQEAEAFRIWEGTVLKKRELFKERGPEICINVSLSLWLNINTHMHRVKLMRPSKNKSQRKQFYWETDIRDIHSSNRTAHYPNSLQPRGETLLNSVAFNGDRRRAMPYKGG